jgi:hypothetical protein
MDFHHPFSTGQHSLTLMHFSPLTPNSPEDVHTVSRNASKIKPAQFVGFFIKNEGAPILTPAP